MARDIESAGGPAAAAVAGAPPAADAGRQFFDDDGMADLLRWCQRHQVLLYARPAGTGVTLGSDETVHVNGKSYVRLWQAVAVPPEARTEHGIHPAPAPLFVSRGLLERLAKELGDDGWGGGAAAPPEPEGGQERARKRAQARKRERENVPLRCLTSVPVRRTFVYVDISDFSKHPAGQQALVINSLIRIAHNDLAWTPPRPGQSGSGVRRRAGWEASLCIGDGYIFVFHDPWDGTLFAAQLARRIETLVAYRSAPPDAPTGAPRLAAAFHFRMGVHAGPVFRFWDPGRQDWNYIGDGITGGQRVLAAVGREVDDVVFVSAAVRQDIRVHRDHADSPEERALCDAVIKHLLNRGRRADKHGNSWRVYEVDHEELGGFDRATTPT